MNLAEMQRGKTCFNVTKKDRFRTNRRIIIPGGDTLVAKAATPTTRANYAAAAVPECLKEAAETLTRSLATPKAVPNLGAPPATIQTVDFRAHRIISPGGDTLFEEEEEEAAPTIRAGSAAAAAAEGWGRADETPTRSLAKTKAVPNLDVHNPTYIIFNDFNLHSKIKNKSELLTETQPSSPQEAGNETNAVNRKLCFLPAVPPSPPEHEHEAAEPTPLAKTASPAPKSKFAPLSYTEMLGKLQAAALDEEKAIPPPPRAVQTAAALASPDVVDGVLGTDTFSQGPYTLRRNIKFVVKPTRKEKRYLRKLWLLFRKTTEV